jgi:hypothetical protein
MSSITLIVTGTAPPGWADIGARLRRASDGGSLDNPDLSAWVGKLAREKGAETSDAGLAGSAPASDNLFSGARSDLSSGGIAPDAIWVMQAIESHLPAARYLIFAENPVDALCAWIQSADEGTLQETLRRWEDSARCVLQQAQRLGERGLLLLASEAQAHPKALVEALQAWLGQAHVQLREPQSADDPAEAADPVARAIAAVAVQADARCRRIWEQLHAATQPLAGQVGDDILGFQLAREVDGEALLQRYRELRQRLRELDRAQAEAAATALAELREENELLLLQLHQVQEELEHYFLEHRKLLEQSEAQQERAAELEDAALSEVRIAALEVGAAHDAPPHRGLDLGVRGLRCGQRQFDRLDLRLVEHRGRPGLALFQDGGAPPPLSAWQQTGEEAGRAFMLLVPSDAPSRAQLQLFPTTDWRLIEGLASLLAQRLAKQSDASIKAWSGVAQRLLTQLREMPPRLRYDDLQVQRVVDGEQESFEICFVNAVFGARRFERLRLRWRPSAAAPLSLSCADAEGNPVALTVRPLDERGCAAEICELPVGTRHDRANKARLWTDLHRDDRALLFSLIDAMPAVPERIAQTGGSTRDIESLRTKARSLLADAHRSAHSRSRRVVAAVLARLGVQLAPMP